MVYHWQTPLLVSANAYNAEVKVTDLLVKNISYIGNAEENHKLREI